MFFLYFRRLFYWEISQGKKYFKFILEEKPKLLGRITEELILIPPENSFRTFLIFVLYSYTILDSYYINEDVAHDKQNVNLNYW